MRSLSLAARRCLPASGARLCAAAAAPRSARHLIARAAVQSPTMAATEVNRRCRHRRRACAPALDRPESLFSAMLTLEQTCALQACIGSMHAPSLQAVCTLPPDLPDRRCRARPRSMPSLRNSTPSTSRPTWSTRRWAVGFGWAGDAGDACAISPGRHCRKRAGSSRRCPLLCPPSIHVKELLEHQDGAGGGLFRRAVQEQDRL